MFHLTLEAGRQAFRAGVTARLDRRRVGVILGNIALPTEKVSLLSREYLGRTFAHARELEKRTAGLTPDEVRAAFRKHIDPKKLVIIRAGDFKK